MNTRNFPLLIIVLLLLAGGVWAQDLPTVEVALSQNRAQLDDLVTANVYVRSSLDIIGADIEVAVDDACLRVGDRTIGDYFPTGEGESFTIYEQKTDSSTRLAMNVLDFDRIPTSGGLFYTVPLRVICDEADVNVDVTYAHLVQRGIIDFKADEGQVNLVNASLTIASDAQAQPIQPLNEEATAIAAPAAAATSSVPLTATSPLVPIALAVMVVSGTGLILMFLWYRRSRRKTG